MIHASRLGRLFSKIFKFSYERMYQSIISITIETIATPLTSEKILTLVYLTQQK